jgi:hypothetical protein
MRQRVQTGTAAWRMARLLGGGCNWIGRPLFVFLERQGEEELILEELKELM